MFEEEKGPVAEGGERGPEREEVRAEGPSWIMPSLVSCDVEAGYFCPGELLSLLILFQREKDQSKTTVGWSRVVPVKMERK